MRDGRPVSHSYLLPLALILRFKPLGVDWLKIMKDYDSINVICETTPSGCMCTQLSIEYFFLVDPFLQSYSMIVGQCFLFVTYHFNRFGFAELTYVDIRLFFLSLCTKKDRFHL